MWLMKTLLTSGCTNQRGAGHYEHLGLDEEKFSDEQLIDFMLQHPILINRPVVVTPLGTRLCRPSEIVLDILPEGQKGAFTKEDGEKIIDETGKRVK